MDPTRVVSAGSLADLNARAARASASAETWFRRGLWTASALAALGVLISAGVMLWARNELSPPESVVAAQSLMLARAGTLYYNLNSYPYTISAYMPIFYLLEASLIKLGLPAFVGGRLISFAAFLGLIVVSARCVHVYTKNRMYQRIAAVMVASSPLMIYWGVVGQVDVLAVFFSVASFYYFSRHQVLGESTLWRAGLLAALALFTKQTMVAAPTAMFLVLCLGDWKKAARFALALGAPLVAAVLALNYFLDGRFLQNTIWANLNPLSGDKFLAQLQYFGSVCGGLLVIVIASLTRLRYGITLAPCVYLGTAGMVFLGTAAKVGSDTNYALEVTVVLAICAAIGLHKLNFLHLHFASSKSAITLLLLPLAVHVVVGTRVAANVFLNRTANEQIFRAEISGLRPYVDAGDSRVLSTDFNAMVRLHQRMDVEPLIYGLLVNAGLVDPEPIRVDLARGAFSTVILHEDVFQPPVLSDAEIASLPAQQLDAVRKHYRLVAHIPGPFLNGVYVYQPVSQGPAPKPAH